VETSISETQASTAVAIEDSLFGSNVLKTNSSFARPNSETHDCRAGFSSQDIFLFMDAAPERIRLVRYG
tara:strand:- start:2035 stop:2241 length:207 start_codon:yes stop_codon:yes gene_type:complete